MKQSILSRIIIITENSLFFPENRSFLLNSTDVWLNRWCLPNSAFDTHSFAVSLSPALSRLLWFTRFMYNNRFQLDFVFIYKTNLAALLLLAYVVWLPHRSVECRRHLRFTVSPKIIIIKKKIYPNLNLNIASAWSPHLYYDRLMHSWAAYALCELCTAADDHEVIMQHNTAAIVVGLMTLSSSLSLFGMKSPLSLNFLNGWLCGSIVFLMWRGAYFHSWMECHN